MTAGAVVSYSDGKWEWFTEDSLMASSSPKVDVDRPYQDDFEHCSALQRMKGIMPA